MEINANNEKDYPSMSEVDIAYRILADLGAPLYYKNLITNVIEKKKRTIQSMAVAISEIYTMINMDGRFQYRGDGQWGLTEWNPPEVKRTRSTPSAVAPPDENDSKSKPYQAISKGGRKRKG